MYILWFILMYTSRYTARYITIHQDTYPIGNDTKKIGNPTSPQNTHTITASGIGSAPRALSLWCLTRRGYIHPSPAALNR